jgi:hypothetical protein
MPDGVVGHVALAADVEVMDIHVVAAARWPAAELASVSRLLRGQQAARGRAPAHPQP